MSGVSGWSGDTSRPTLGEMAAQMLLAIDAGADILVFSNNSRDVPYDPDLAPNAHRIILDLVAKGELPEARIVESWNRIAKIKRSGRLD